MVSKTKVVFIFFFEVMLLFTSGAKLLKKEQIKVLSAGENPLILSKNLNFYIELHKIGFLKYFRLNLCNEENSRFIMLSALNKLF